MYTDPVTFVLMCSLYFFREYEIARNEWSFIFDAINES